MLLRPGFDADCLMFDCLTERFHMIRLASTSPSPVKGMTRTALMRSEPALSAPPASLPTAAAPDAALEIPTTDWDDLFHAVLDRLSHAGRHTSMPLPGSAPNAVTSDIRATVLECVAALEQLHASLTQERKWRQQAAPLATDPDARGKHEAEVVARSLAELVGIPAASLASVQDSTLHPSAATLNPSGGASGASEKSVAKELH